MDQALQCFFLVEDIDSLQLFNVDVVIGRKLGKLSYSVYTLCVRVYL